MLDSRPNLFASGLFLNLEQLGKWQEKPAPFEPGEPLFWDDPHISKQMLAAHLDPNSDLASRRPETIERSISWMVKTLDLQPGAVVLDLGCGPGLYATRLSQLGLKVTGIDYSRRSIEYATNRARELALDVRYRYENYLELNDPQLYDLALLIFGDFCTLAPELRQRLLQNIHQALRPEGYFVFDVSTREHRKRHASVNAWHVLESGFWKPGLHLVLEQGFDYPEQSIHLDQVIVVEVDGRLWLYRMWFQDYTREAIVPELQQAGFAIHSVWGDLTGAAFDQESEWIGVVAQKV